MPSEASPLQFPPSPGNAAILVVDEDPAFQLGLKTFLREYVGFSEVFTANSGPEALELIENEESIELVTLDYRMPGMNGIEVMEELSRSAPRPLSVTMITGYPSDELEEEFRSFGSSRLLTDYFLHKPVEFEKLEPLMLRAHEELESAKRTLEHEKEEEATGEELIPEEAATGSLQEQLRRQEEKLEAIEQKVERLRRKWRADFWTVVLLGALIWAAVHFHWLEKAQPFWEKAKADAQLVFQRGGGAGEKGATVEPNAAGVPAAGVPAAGVPAAGAPEAEESTEDPATPGPAGEQPAEGRPL